MGIIRTLIVTVVLLAALTAPAPVTTSTRLDQKSILIQKRFAFKVDATKMGNTVQFSVTIHPNEAAPSETLDAQLMLFNGEDEIRCEKLEPLERKHRSASYEFEVASNYVAQSQFVFRDLGKSAGGKMDAADSFWFFLKDFISDK